MTRRKNTFASLRIRNPYDPSSAISTGLTGNMYLIGIHSQRGCLDRIHAKSIAYKGSEPFTDSLPELIAFEKEF